MAEGSAAFILQHVGGGRRFHLPNSKLVFLLKIHIPFKTCNIRAILENENTLQRLKCIRYFNLVKNQIDKMNHSADQETTQFNIYQETTGSL